MTDKLTQLREKIRRVAQDKDVDDKKGTQPKKYYSGVDKKKKSARDAHFKKGANMDDDNPNAYKYAPGDLDKDGEPKKTKVSKHTKKYKQMFGENYDGDMAQNSLENIIRNANNLKRVVKEDGDYPAWWNSKLTKADDYLDVCHDYLMSELSQSEQIEEELKSSDRSYIEKRVKMIDQLEDKLIRMRGAKGTKEAQTLLQKARFALEDVLEDPMNEDGLPDIDNSQVLSDLEEGKLVANVRMILDTMTKEWKKKATIQYDKDPEKGLRYIQRLGAIIGAKVTDKAQQKNHLFLKMGDALEEQAPNTADAMKRYKSGKAGFTDKAHLKAKGLIPRADGTKKKSPKYEDIDENAKLKKQLSKIKGLTKDQLQMLLAMPPVTLQTVINQLSTLVMSEKLGKDADAGDYIDDFRKSDAPQFKGKSDKKIRDMAIAAYLSKKEKK